MTVITDRPPPIVQDWYGPVVPSPVRRESTDDALEIRHKARLAQRRLAFGKALSDLGVLFRRVGDLPRADSYLLRAAAELQAAIELSLEAA